MVEDPDILDLRRDLACAALDGALVQGEWVCRFLQNGHDDHAIAAFERTMMFIRSAAEEMKAIRAALPVKDALTGDAAPEWRAERGAKGKTSARAA